MADYRPIPEGGTEESRRVVRYAFDAASGPAGLAEPLDERRRRYWSFSEPRGLFEDGELLACCDHLRFSTRVRGAWLPLAGLTAVASPPERRREGAVGELIEASLAEYRDRGWPLSALRPFSEPFYARYGWATGCRYWTVEVDPGALSPTERAAAGEFRRVEPAEFERLEPAYDAWLSGVNLATRRGDDWWRDRVFHRHDSELYCYAWERAGEVRGYLLYRIVETDADPRLVADELAYADHEALLNLLRFCHGHGAQVGTVELSGRSLAGVVDAVADRDAVSVGVNAGHMVRIVDVAGALEAVPYPGVEDAAVTLAVADDHAPWNEATFRLRVEDGAATVEETGSEPEASLGVGTLSQLLVGYRSVERARAAGDLRVGDPAAAGTLATLFPEGEPYLPEGF
jgi:predicted acetyltransferase